MGTVRFTRTSPGGRGQHQVVQFKRKTGAEALVFDLPGSILRRITVFAPPEPPSSQDHALGTHHGSVVGSGHGINHHMFE